MLIVGVKDLTNPIPSKPAEKDGQDNQSVKPVGVKTPVPVPGQHFPDPDSLDMSHFK